MISLIGITLRASCLHDNVKELHPCQPRELSPCIPTGAKAVAGAKWPEICAKGESHVYDGTSLHRPDVAFCSYVFRFHC